MDAARGDGRFALAATLLDLLRVSESASFVVVVEVAVAAVEGTDIV